VTVYNTAISDTVKSAALIQMNSEDFPKVDPKVIDCFIDGMQQTDRPYEVDKKIIKIIYDNTTGEQQDRLAGYMDAKDLTERHRDALTRPYLTPKSGESKKWKPLKHTVEKHPIHQLFRLLVHLAR
jgi:hypothetical protein